MSNIRIIKDSYITNAQMLFSNSVTKYSKGFENLSIKYEDIEPLIEQLNQKMNFVRNDFSFNLFNETIFLENNDHLIVLESYDSKKKVDITYYFMDYTEAKPLFDIINEYRDDEDEIYIRISSFFMDSSKNVSFNDSTKSMKDYSKISLDYYPFINVKEMFNQYIMSDSNILLLAGTTGTGKTKLGDAFMHHLLINSEKAIKQKGKSNLKVYESMVAELEGVKVAYIKNEGILADDIFWNILREEKYNLVFLDDLDYSLLPRKQNITSSEDIQKNKFISNLLSFTDGIFENGNKTKFVITTNRTVEDIDDAIIRKGRTFDILSLRKLKSEEAKTIWLKELLDENLFYETFGSDEVLQADLGDEISLHIKARETNRVLRSYIKENDISVYNKYKHKIKIGL